METVNQKIGLVLEGGGMRGLYTVGVLDLFNEYNYMPDYAIGVSAGACNGTSYISKQKGRGYRVIIDHIGSKKYVSVSNFLKTKSLFGMDYIFDEIPNKLDPFDFDTFLSNKTEFVVGVTDVLTGKPVFYDKDQMQKDTTALRASSSIPIFSPIVKYRGGKYLDGGTSNPIPLEKALDDGCDKLIIVLTQHRGYEKKPEKFRLIYKRKFKKYPEMIRLLDERYKIYNKLLNKVNYLEKQGKAIVIAPSSPISIGRFENKKEKLDEIYNLGKQDALKRINEILNLKNNNKVEIK